MPYCWVQVHIHIWGFVAAPGHDRVEICRTLDLVRRNEALRERTSSVVSTGSLIAIPRICTRGHERSLCPQSFVVVHVGTYPVIGGRFCTVVVVFAREVPGLKILPEQIRGSLHSVRGEPGQTRPVLGILAAEQLDGRIVFQTVALPANLGL